MNYFAPSVETLIDEFSKLPGIGRKTAQRLAFHILNLPKEDADKLAQAITAAKNTIHLCPVCQNLTDEELCPICADPARDHKTICVVADPKDVLAFEKTREYQGLYHVLHGTISPLNHVGPDDLSIRELLHRVAEEDIEEVILATNPDTEGGTAAQAVSHSRQPPCIRHSGWRTAGVYRRSDVDARTGRQTQYRVNKKADFSGSPLFLCKNLA